MLSLSGLNWTPGKVPLVVSLFDSDGRNEKFGSVLLGFVVLELFSLDCGVFVVKKVGKFIFEIKKGVFRCKMVLRENRAKFLMFETFCILIREQSVFAVWNF